MRKLGDCQITEATMEVDAGLVKVVLESPEDRNADNLKGGVQMSQRSYVQSIACTLPPGLSPAHARTHAHVRGARCRCRPLCLPISFSP